MVTEWEKLRICPTATIARWLHNTSAFKDAMLLSAVLQAVNTDDMTSLHTILQLSVPTQLYFLCHCLTIGDYFHVASRCLSAMAEIQISAVATRQISAAVRSFVGSQALTTSRLTAVAEVRCTVENELRKVCCSAAIPMPCVPPNIPAVRCRRGKRRWSHVLDPYVPV